ncbi:MAG TPA: bifunctional (p)ppGpp synthetase/guanosine-3',5'-bis(diphosphate) 3'-pyrophosphohydrolase [Bacillota bacterium]|nr:bifunctional (p)ppGpp synthetase/guanosine-3',5'-bis(diphosphate) 3'-pyrophosphohydrolase [Bacillota bacterium]
MQRRLEKLLQKLTQSRPDADTRLIADAFAFAQEAHGEQKRESGEPFVSHPLGVAEILVSLQMDDITVAASLLHDVVEDTEVTLEEIQERFGPEVAALVDGVTKLSRLPFQSKQEQQAESLRKMFLAMARDIRVIIIKLADRLHNMRTLRNLPVERQKKIARETLEIYAPLTHRLGMYKLKWELEDLALRYLEPKEYYNLVQLVKKKRQERERYINEVMDTLQSQLKELKIQAKIEGRPKHFYSIYQKMVEKGREFTEIYDLIAIRVIVESVKDCYAVLGIVHTLWKPVPGRFKDYIAMPKSNQYQSLHTTVIGPGGEPFEIQIRTWEMHHTAEYGVAAHWRYKEGGGEDKFEDKISWLRQLLEWQREMKDAQDFLETLKIDLFEDEVFVFTPKGDVKSLPAGSTPVDFAYSVHSDIGHRCTGAKVNGKLVPLNTKLKNGDIVEIITSKNSKPSGDWLSFIKTSKARSKVRQYVRETQKQQATEDGRELLEKEARKYNFEPREVLLAEKLAELARKHGYADTDDLYAAIGFGRLTANQTLEKLVGSEKLKKQKQSLRQERQLERQKRLGLKRKARPSQGVRAPGLDNLLIRFSRCCNPVPGDDIVGYITRGRGVSVHRKDCPNLGTLSTEEGRIIEVFWEGTGQSSYPVELEVLAEDRVNLLSNIMLAVSEMKTNIVAVHGRTLKNKQAQIDLVVDIKDLDHMQAIIAQLQNVEGVLSAHRHFSGGRQNVH